MRYWTSDLHLGHKNIITYCNRPYSDVTHMTTSIAQYLLSMLKKDDELIVVGDVALKPQFAFELGRQLSAQGVKLMLVMGNHDACFPEKESKREHALNMKKKYENAGWEVTLSYETFLADGTPVLVSHLPYGNEDGLKYDQRYRSFRPADAGKVLIHGHLHGKYKKFGRMIDVGFDPHEGKILSEEEVIALVKDPRDFIPCHLTDHHEYRRVNGLEKTEMKGL